MALSPIHATFGGGQEWDSLRDFLERQGRWNAAAAIATAVAIVLQVVAAVVR
jgi:hypothetical protein